VGQSNRFPDAKQQLFGALVGSDYCRILGGHGLVVQHPVLREGCLVQSELN
jgi:hypothetical protein